MCTHMHTFTHHAHVDVRSIDEMQKQCYESYFQKASQVVCDYNNKEGKSLSKMNIIIVWLLVSAIGWCYKVSAMKLTMPVSAQKNLTCRGCTHVKISIQYTKKIS